MTIAREQLIADWRKRLAAAEEAPAGSSQRFAWLAGVRIRLYRFLLSLYGDGEWDATPMPPVEKPPDPGAASVVFDSPNVLPLSRTPAKSDGEIRAALEAVASAQDASRTLGPLASGLPPDSWVVATSVPRRRDLVACVAWLREYNIPSRSVRHGADVSIEVMAKDRAQAFRILACRDVGTERTEHPEASRRAASSCYVTIGAWIGPIIGLLAVRVIDGVWPSTWQPPTPEVFVLAFLGTWGASVVAGAIFDLISMALHSLKWGPRGAPLETGHRQRD